MNEKYELTDEQLDALLMMHGKGDDGFRGYARAIIAADRALRASPAVGDGAIPSRAWIQIKQPEVSSLPTIPEFRMPTPYKPQNHIYSADQMREYAQAALAAKDLILDAKCAEIEAMKLRLLSASEGSQRAKEAEMFYRDAERMLTTGEKELHAEIARLKSELARPESLEVGFMRSEIAAHVKQLDACKSLIDSLERQRTTLREGAEKWDEAVKSLLSEREANAILTSEIARLQSDLARPESLAVGLMRAEIAAKDTEIATLKTRLEVDPAHAYDGIACRDATIKLQDDQLATLTAERDALRKDAERLSWIHYNLTGTSIRGTVVNVLADHASLDSFLSAIDAAMTKEA